MTRTLPRRPPGVLRAPRRHQRQLGQGPLRAHFVALELVGELRGPRDHGGLRQVHRGRLPLREDGQPGVLHEGGADAGECRAAFRRGDAPDVPLPTVRRVAGCVRRASCARGRTLAAASGA
eukprot:12402771-Alexandrium_andersonii.AAC.1